MTTTAAPATARSRPVAGVGAVLDPETAYRALASRDRRFDGRLWFGVTTTGIYCRPVCPAQTPKPDNVRLFAAPAAAVSAGFRACRRCRPDAQPGTRDWDQRGDLAARALRLLADGAADDGGVAGLARRLHVSERHLHRTLVAEVGAGPQQLAISRRAQTARLLIDQTDLPLTDVAFAAGFASVRQFNEVMRREFGVPPSRLRRRAAGDQLPAGPPALVLRLSMREPYDADSLGRWLAARAVAALERHDPAVEDAAWSHRRVLALPHGAAVVSVVPGSGFVTLRASVPDLRDIPGIVSRVRAWLDLDADPDAVDRALAADPALAPLVRARPGLPVPTSVDRFEGLVRTVLGQQVSVAAARTLLGRLVSRFGDAVGEPDGLDRPLPADAGSATAPPDAVGTGDGEAPWRSFPTPDALAAAAPADLAAVGMPASRARALQAVAGAVVEERLPLAAEVPREESLAALRALPGVGPWTTDYAALRVFGDPDAFPATDLVIRSSAAAQGIPTTGLLARSRAWSPWRAYAAQHLWSASTDSAHRNRAQEPQTDRLVPRSGGRNDPKEHR